MFKSIKNAYTNTAEVIKKIIKQPKLLGAFCLMAVLISVLSMLSKFEPAFLSTTLPPVLEVLKVIVIMIFLGIVLLLLIVPSLFIPRIVLFIDNLHRVRQGIGIKQMLWFMIMLLFIIFLHVIVAVPLFIPAMTMVSFIKKTMVINNISIAATSIMTIGIILCMLFINMPALLMCTIAQAVGDKLKFIDSFKLVFKNYRIIFSYFLIHLSLFIPLIIFVVIMYKALTAAELNMSIVFLKELMANIILYIQWILAATCYVHIKKEDAKAIKRLINPSYINE